MTDIERLEYKLNLVIELVNNVIPQYISAPHTKNPEGKWKRAANDHKRLLDKYEKLIEDEYNNNIAS